MTQSINDSYITGHQLIPRPKDTSIYLPDVIGKGYATFWNYTGRYRVVKGGRGSKKSTTSAIWFPFKMMEFYERYGLKPHTLVIRRYYNTHKDSTYAQLKWAINRLGVAHKWKATKSPLELIYKPSGQRIMFRGMDDPDSITSITVDDGYLCWTWWEEAFQITNEDDFNRIDLSIRGDLPEPLFKQHTLVFNPWSEKIWLKERFFDAVGQDGRSKDGDILAITRNWDCNEFLGDDDREIFKRMKRDNPRRYAIEGEGQWGIAEGLVYINWREAEFDVESLKRARDTRGGIKYRQFYGMDFGFTNDPTAFIAILVSEKERKIFIYDELYKYHMGNKEIVDALTYKGYQKVIIRSDREPRTVSELKKLGLNRLRMADKGPDSVRAGIQKLQDYEFIVHPRCVNTLVELNNYVWETDKYSGKPINVPVDEYNHLMDALRYAAEPINADTFSW